MAIMWKRVILVDQSARLKGNLMKIIVCELLERKNQQPRLQ